MFDIEFWKSIKGFMEEDEARRLYALALQAAEGVETTETAVSIASTTTPVTTAKNPLLEIGSYCGKSAYVLGSPCKIKNSILGLRSKVGPNVEIENSYLMGADCYDDEIDKKLNGHGPHPRPYLGIGEGSIIRNAIIDKNVRIGKNVKIINVNNLKKEIISAPHYTIADGLVIIAKDAIIPDNTII